MRSNLIFFCDGDEIWTCDLKLMSLASYQTALRRDEEKNWEPRNKQGPNAPVFHTLNRIAYL